MAETLERSIDNYFFPFGFHDQDYSTQFGEEQLRIILGNKGLNLRRASEKKQGVPEGFTISSEITEYYLEHGTWPENFEGTVKDYVSQLEQQTGLILNDLDNRPLLVSVRSGAWTSMPGAMETILNVGLTREAMEAYISRTDNANEVTMILDSYRRLQQMFGENVTHIEGSEFTRVIDEIKERDSVKGDNDLSVEHLREIIDRFDDVYKNHDEVLPQNPIDQILLAIGAVQESSQGAGVQAALNIDGNLDSETKIYTAVNIQAMAFGNYNRTNSGSGVAFTRDPETGERKFWGEFGLGYQGEDVVNGRVDSKDLWDMNKLQAELPEVYRQLEIIMTNLEQENRTVQDIEFTVQNGKVYLLQNRDAKMHGVAAVRSALEMYDEGLIDRKELIDRITPENLEQILTKQINWDQLKNDGVDLNDYRITMDKQGVAASPGVGVGEVVFDVKTALQYQKEGKAYVLARTETNPEDVEAMAGAQAVITARGGKTSHAAVVCRGKGVTAYVGTGLEIDQHNKTITYTVNGEVHTISQGEILTIDGSHGVAYKYEAPLKNPHPDNPHLKQLIGILKDESEMRVFGNGNDADEVAKAFSFGAEGIGLARTEYMFLEDRREGENRALTIRSWVLTGDETHISRLAEFQQNDFREMYEVAGSKPIIFRLMDYPLHELLPKMEHKGGTLTKETLESLGDIATHARMELSDVIHKVENMQENDPMLGHRAVRLGVSTPELYRMQVAAIFDAARSYNEGEAENGYATPFIEIPLVSFQKEPEIIKKIIEEEAAKRGFSRGEASTDLENRYQVGVMFETPASTDLGGKFARTTDYGSFGSNDATQTTLALSREDSSNFASEYERQGIISGDPFVSITGPVALQMARGMDNIHHANENYEMGICGDQAGDPVSVITCYRLGLDNVSPPPLAVPTAWLMSAKASLGLEVGPHKDYQRGDFRDMAHQRHNKILEILPS